MKSRFWNSWTKEEPKVRSSIVVKERDDMKRNCEEFRTKTRQNDFQIRDNFSSNRNGKLRNSGLDDEHEDDDDDNESPVNNGKNSEFIWDSEKNSFYESRRRKSKNTDTDHHDKCNQVKLTNGKSRTSNGFVKQVKRSDESLRSLDCERQGANFQPSYDEKKRYFYNDEVRNGNCEPIKFVRKIEEFEYRRDTDDLKSIHQKCQKPSRTLLSRASNGDLVQGRSLSTAKDDPGSKGCKEEFVYVDKRSLRNDNDRLFDRDIEENGRHIINGSRRSRSNDYSQKKRGCDKEENVEKYNSQILRYDRTREPRRSSDLVKSSKENSFNEPDGGLRQRSSSSYRKDKLWDEKAPSKSRESSSRRESSRDRQIFRKISFKLKPKDPSKKDLKNNNESDSIRSKPRRDNHRHSRALSPPTLEDLEVEDVSRHCKVFSSKDYRDECIKEEKKSNHNYRGSRDLTWVEKELSWYSSEESPERGTRFSSDNDDSDDVGFSTIERNGTTVIRIHTNSRSPDRFKSSERTSRERRYQCRRSRNNVAMRHYNRYDEEEDAEEDDEEEEDDMDEDIDFFSRKKRPSDSLSTRNHRDSSVQITDLEDGQPCLQCGETCSGFSPHTWRKNCTSCKCPKEVHDVCHEEWVSVRARLGLKGEDPNNYVAFDPREKGLAWAPPGLPPHKVEEYFSMLPEISVPRLGTPGERHRDRQLATQLPKQDLARAYCRHLDSRHYASADDFMAARNEIALDIGSVQEVLERGHECGVCHEPLKYGSLAVMASKLGILYHPSCFQCTQCRELLVDLAYCVHDDALYCERHYAEKLMPRCAACDELIFSGEYTKAMNKDWHSGHFCCWQCDESLTGQRYVLRDEHPYCIKCYESVFANGCEECNKIIGIDSKDLSYKDKHWHEACFLCNKCRVSLVDKQFGSKVDKIYCGNCYDAQFASRCDGCGEIFRAGTKKMEYKTRQWHEKCFCCVVCKNPIGTKSFIPREQEIYCASCYEDKFATRCVKCNKIITSGGVTYKQEPWHRDCFTCSHCNNSLAGQRFTSRDDKPYCAECFGELFAKRCTACSKPITGIGGTRFISFEDRHWHNDCFICAGCNTSLVGRGFITDGDDIICPECAKQKLSE